MLFAKQKYKMDGLISNSTDIDGDIKFKGGLRIEGNVKGNVTADSDEKSILVIAETATIEGEVHAAHIIINGKVIGQVTSTKILELEEKANLLGDVVYEKLEMHSGAIVSGKLIPKKSENTVSVKKTEEKVNFVDVKEHSGIKKEHSSIKTI